MNNALHTESINWGAMTQKERVLYWLENYGTITQEDGKDHLGIARVASRINDLRKEGHNIITLAEKCRNRFGENVTYARYQLIRKGELL